MAKLSQIEKDLAQYNPFNQLSVIIFRDLCLWHDPVAAHFADTRQ